MGQDYLDIQWCRDTEHDCNHCKFRYYYFSPAENLTNWKITTGEVIRIMYICRVEDLSGVDSDPDQTVNKKTGSRFASLLFRHTFLLLFLEKKIINNLYQSGFPPWRPRCPSTKKHYFIQEVLRTWFFQLLL